MEHVFYVYTNGAAWRLCLLIWTRLLVSPRLLAEPMEFDANLTKLDTINDKTAPWIYTELVADMCRVGRQYSSLGLKSYPFLASTPTQKHMLRLCLVGGHSLCFTTIIKISASPARQVMAESVKVRCGCRTVARRTFRSSYTGSRDLAQTRSTFTVAGHTCWPSCPKVGQTSTNFDEIG